MWHTIWQWTLDPANQRLLLGTVIAFGIGLIAGRWIHRAKDIKGESMTSKGDKAFFKGVQYMLSNDHDQAIEEFTKSVQVNSDTIETYVALGNLYRSKGDIDRAIRIRQNIILRPNIDDQIKLRALFDLGVDYRKAGFLNRALKTFLKVTQKTPSDAKALENIERIYEELKDWDNAYRTRQKLAGITKGDHRHILAHHLVEMGKVAQEKGELNSAKSLFNKAVSTQRECVDAYLHLGDLYFKKKDYKRGISTWEKAVEAAPQFSFLPYRRLEGAYTKMKDLKPIGDFLKECAQSNADAFTHLALARYLYNENDIDDALDQIRIALELAPSFWEARKFRGEILLADDRKKDALTDYRELIEQLNVAYLRFQCTECGFMPSELQWQCPQCKTWDSIQLIDQPRARSTPATQPKNTLPQLPQGIDEA
ncbi:MAG: tetratricopeptide repeat protein [Pseudomonadota bacterium]